MMSGYILTEAILAEMREWAKKTGVTPESTLVLGDQRDLGYFIRANASVIQRWLIEAPDTRLSEWLSTKPVIRVAGVPWSPALEEAIWVVGWHVVLSLALTFAKGDVIVVSNVQGGLEILNMGG